MNNKPEDDLAFLVENIESPPANNGSFERC